MKFDHRHYVPCLRWKQGEYQAFYYLSESAKKFITPLIEVPEKGFDFETRVETRTIDAHLAPFAKRVWTKWQRRPCFIDLKLIGAEERMADRRHPVRFVFDELGAQGCEAVPVTGFARDTDYQRAVCHAIRKDKRGMCLRLTLEEVAKSEFKSMIDVLLSDYEVPPEKCDFILDLGSPNFIPLEGFSKVVEALVRRLPFLPKWRTFTIIGTSFPPTMAEIRTGTGMIQRSEWLLYKLLAATLNNAKIRVPAFGDYAVSHPDVLPLDMRIVKPSATIRYAIDDAWLIVKGSNVRDYGFGQYRSHCRTVMATPHYPGPDFSDGDRHISDCAIGKASTGNLSTWRRVGTNRHLEKVVQDVANFFASSSRLQRDVAIPPE